MSIQIRNVGKRFGNFVALEDVSLEVETGSLTALLGPSGSGKSTLLRIVAGLEKPDTGSVHLDGEEVTARPPQARGVGLVFQHYAAFKHLTVRKNVAFALEIRRRPKHEIATRVDELLDLVQLHALADRYPAQLSGGQRQRMALARALAAEPSVLLLDEPFGALDARVRKQLRRWLRRLHDEQQVTTVIVTHDQEEAMDVADRIALIHDGRVQQIGEPRELYDQPVNEVVRAFFGPIVHTKFGPLRPHELALSLDESPGSVEAMVSRVVHLGFEVRVDLLDGDGRALSAQLTRDEEAELELDRGQIVFVSPRYGEALVRAPGLRVGDKLVQ